MKIYADYDDEPREEFLMLTPEMYRQMYDLELSGFREDIHFYMSHLLPGSDILELGCGSGRLTRLLAAAGHNITGIDLSMPMLQRAKKQNPRSRFVCMDMRNIAFFNTFSAVVIPYNTLNLLTDNEDVQRCLYGCLEQLNPGGHLLLQLYIPADGARREHAAPSFQFQILDLPQGGKVVKETLRSFQTSSSTITMEERYKIRPMNGIDPNSNYRHTMFLNGNDRTTWLELIQSAGFTIRSTSSSYDTDDQQNPNLLLISAQRS